MAIKRTVNNLIDLIPGGGGSLIFSYMYIRRLGPFLVKNFEFLYFWWFSEKLNLWGMMELWIFFGDITKLDYFGGHFNTL